MGCCPNNLNSFGPSSCRVQVLKKAYIAENGVKIIATILKNAIEAQDTELVVYVQQSSKDALLKETMQDNGQTCSRRESMP